MMFKKLFRFYIELKRNKKQNQMCDKTIELAEIKVIQLIIH